MAHLKTFAKLRIQGPTFSIGVDRAEVGAPTANDYNGSNVNFDVNVVVMNNRRLLKIFFLQQDFDFLNRRFFSNLRHFLKSIFLSFFLSLCNNLSNAWNRLMRLNWLIDTNCNLGYRH